MVETQDKLINRTFSVGNSTIDLRATLASTSSSANEPLLWTDLSSSTRHATGSIVPSLFDQNQSFMAQIPTGYNTGIIRQFATGVANDGFESQIISHSDWPRSCNENSNVPFYASLGNLGVNSVQACMPEASSFARNATDFLQISDSLFINNIGLYKGPGTHNMTFKITVNTTLFDFELPGESNGGTTGFAIAESISTCVNDYECNNGDSVRSTYHETVEQSDKYPGPLRISAEALLGNGSFLSTLAGQDDFVQSCQHLCENPEQVAGWITPIPIPRGCPCSSSSSRASSDTTATDVYVRWLRVIVEPEFWNKNLPPILTLANREWLKVTPPSGSYYLASGGSKYIYSDPGMQIQAPKISTTGIALISTLLATYLIALISMTIYAYRAHLWTDRLDSFAMMRIGAAKANLFPLGVCEDADLYEALDNEPGWVGDAGVDEPVGRLAIGSGQVISKKRPFEKLYPGKSD